MKKTGIVLLVMILCLGCALSASALVLKVGSTGSTVKQVQQKLNSLGYWAGTADGIFGSKTKSAVISFQRAKGLTVDGIVGPATFKALGITTGTSTYTSADVTLLARLISAEARGESYKGQVAVGAVVLNRVKHPSFPNTISGVIYQQGAFSCLSDGQFYKAVTSSATQAAKEALAGSDPTYGAIYYYNPRTATNKWIRSRPVLVTIGNHIFCS